MMRYTRRWPCLAWRGLVWRGMGWQKIACPGPTSAIFCSGQPCTRLGVGTCLEQRNVFWSGVVWRGLTFA
eukprot:10144388-Lingulodinium_polyedra.AAC.1